MGAPVIVGNLHSQIAPAAAGVKAARADARVAYVMTDAAAPPLGLSRPVRGLRPAELLDGPLTARPASDLASPVADPGGGESAGCRACPRSGVRRRLRMRPRRPGAAGRPPH